MSDIALLALVTGSSSLTRLRGREARMPGLGFIAAERSGDQVRGPCRIHGSASPDSRSFSANLGKSTFQCFKCGAKGNQLNLYVAVTRLAIHEAALELCKQAGIDEQQVR